MQGYIDKLNELVSGTQIVATDGRIFNNAAQTWNHDFYWKSLTPKKEAIPSIRKAA